MSGNETAAVSVFARQVCRVYYCEEDCLNASARKTVKAKHKHKLASQPEGVSPAIICEEYQT